jgi:ubiquinone biosynthesis protein UbiJ
MKLVHAVSQQVVAAAVPAGMLLRFDPEAARDLDTTLELRLAGSDARFAVRVAEGRCTVARRAAPEAAAHVTISAGDLVRLISGTVPWTALLARGRLELGGDPFLALRFPKLFRVGPGRGS